MAIIKLRFPDHCHECKRLLPAGALARYAGPGTTTCPGCRPLARVRIGRRYVVHGGHAATGRRCEDAPCCGCCD